MNESQSHRLEKEKKTEKPRLSLEALARAKVNMHLSFFPKKTKDQALHSMGSVFHSISLADKLKVSHGSAGAPKLKIIYKKASSIAQETKEYSLAEPDIFYKTLAGIEEELNRVERIPVELPPLHLELEKHIPVGAGLGGGSADAAAFLKLCNKLLSLNLSEERMLKIAFKIGSDVPFFLKGGMALVEGYGEKVRKLPFSLTGPLLLYYPGWFFSTAQAFKKRLFLSEASAESRFYKLREALLHESRNYESNAAAESVKAMPAKLFTMFQEFQENAFREKSMADFSYLARVVSDLREKFAFVELSGSGSAVFACMPKWGESKNFSRHCRQSEAFHATIHGRKNRLAKRKTWKTSQETSDTQKIPKMGEVAEASFLKTSLFFEAESIVIF